MKMSWRIAALAGAVFLALAAVATAGDDGRPETQEVAANIVFNHIEGKFRECEGKDGLYSNNRITLTGTSVGHPALSGSVEVRYEELFRFTPPAFGPQWGRIVIRDLETRKKKAEGRFDNTGPDEITQGVIVGHVFTPTSGDDDDDDNGGAWSLVANWRITYRQDGGIDAQIGGVAADNRLPAGIQRGQCSGRFESFEGPLPTEEGASVGASVTKHWRAPSG
jgi:hypothetical protein